MICRFLFGTVLCCGCLFAPFVSANQPTSPAEMASRVDELLAERWQQEQIEPAPLSSDSQFLRRAYLDFTGVVPHVWHVRQFLASEQPDKRQQLIEELLASPRYATHLANTWRNRMLPAGIDEGQINQVVGVHNWLRERFARNLRFDGLVYDLLIATRGDDVGPALYFQAHELAPEKLAASTAELFLGTRLNCAQCHDHPYEKWTQTDFWGLAAFFARVRAADGRMAMGMYDLTDIDSGEVRHPDTKEIMPPKFLGGDLAEESPRHTRRRQLALWIASRDNPYLARATVNWAWAHLFGRGLIEPVGDSGSHNPPSHPELLEELSQYFIRSGYDLKQLFRTLAQTEAYGLAGQAELQEPPPAELFAAMQPKALSPEQLCDSVIRGSLLQTGSASQYAGMPAIFASNNSLDPRRIAFIRQMQTPTTSRSEYTAGILQALMLINGDVISAATNEDSGGLLGALQAPFMSDRERIETLFLATLSRFPSPEEQQEFQELLKAAETTEQKVILSDALWVLLNSTEFTFNH